ncbi:DgyrCDS5305 [Dimorphilus gyrociliatus]|uniref:DgyrCDS5305 n=1 Tax=Dimorphilus gyrociliatus TaxID=2664684 RepID=A0A7I8VJG9_9ANNE|nr:DgyrCDS5305 [Dimorphilus gyrociliatus]
MAPGHIIENSDNLNYFIEKATSEKNTTEDLALIMDIVDKVKATSNGPAECLKSIVKRLTNKHPHVAMQALTLLDYCVNNCGHKFHLEIASRDFENDCRNLVSGSKTHRKVAQKLRFLIKKWSENEFKNNSSLSLIPSLYESLKNDGQDFHDPDEKPQSTKERQSDLQKKEMEDLRKAMEESMKIENQKKNQTSAPISSLYPSFNTPGAPTATAPAPTTAAAAAAGEDRKVRAVYDFEAAEDNELTFKAGELVILLDDSDAHWWKGSNHRGEGLFPANFVSKDISELVSESGSGNTKKSVSFNGEVEVKQFETEGQTADSKTIEQPTQIDEGTIDRALSLLHDADAGPDGVDTDELTETEEKSKMMTPLIDNELEAVDRRYNALCELNSTVTAAMQLYHHLMRTAPRPGAFGGNVPTQQSQPPNQVAHAVQNVPAGPNSAYFPPPQQPQHQNMEQQQPQSLNYVPQASMPPGGGQSNNFSPQHQYSSMQTPANLEPQHSMPPGAFVQNPVASQPLL